MVYLNLVLGIVEMMTIECCVYWFLSHNERTIYLKKLWYVLLFGAGGSLLFLSALMPGLQGWGNVAVLLVEILAIGRLGFHKGPGPLVWDSLFFLLQFLLMEIGILITQFLAVAGWVKNPLALGNLSMAVKCILIPLGTMGLVKWKNRIDPGKLKIKQLLLIVVFPVLSMFLFVTMVEMSAVYVQLYGFLLLAAALLVLFFMNVYFLFLLRYLYRSKALEQEMEIASVHSEIQYKYYGELEKRYQKSRKVLHDMKNHLQAVERLYRQETPERGDVYVKDLYHMMNILGEKYYTSDKLLNIILNEKLEEAQRKGVEVRTEIGEVSFSDMRDMDITTIFANLLDNAVEAASEAERRFLSIKMDTVREFRVVSLVNGCPAEKKKSRGHQGLGLENVGHTLKKYHGSIQTEEGNQEFRVNIMVPASARVDGADVNSSKRRGGKMR